jgi:hypothetical protein
MSSEGMATEGRKFRSPNRILARFFRISRDSWKEKAQEQTRQRRKLTKRLAAVEQSRDEWRQKAEAAEAEQQRLAEELTREKAFREEAEKRGALKISSTQGEATPR